MGSFNPRQYLLSRPKHYLVDEIFDKDLSIRKLKRRLSITQERATDRERLQKEANRGWLAAKITWLVLFLAFLAWLVK